MFAPSEGERERRPLNKRSAKQIHDQQRQRTRVYIGGALRRWRALMRDRGFQSHAEVWCEPERGHVHRAVVMLTNIYMMLLLSYCHQTPDNIYIYHFLSKS
uniref:Uncharacterized protein n=1 Tax=Scophthalmus maximus TaxID=52904 RepID=A0A8D3DZI5_SCOMX